MDEASLRVMIGTGESDAVEFKVDFPRQARDLAKEIAAFASTKGGVILLGVSDKGQVIGLAGIETVNGATSVKARIEGICARSIDPPVSAQIEVMSLGTSNIVVVEVPNNLNEVHFVVGVPYIRCSSISRPATSQEVKQRVLLADILVRLHELEGKLRPGTQVAAGITGQGDLATMNKVDLANWIERRERRRIP